ncbi:MAG: putative photosynthetic complex assembly protein PuhE [Pseudomonadota bacterium]
MLANPVIAVIIAVASWWIATGIGLMIAHARIDRFWMMFTTSVTTLFAIGIVAFTVNDTSAFGAYAALLGALLIWGWHEVAFLLGIITGPRRDVLPKDVSDQRRFFLAFQALRDHELALFATMIVFVAFLWTAENQAAMWMFVLLWAMRISTKLNIFFGAPNAVSELLPTRLSYLKSYFRTDRVNPYFAFSVLLALAVFCVSARLAFVAVDDGATVTWSALAAFAGLGLLEHFFLVLPMRDAELWRILLPKNNKKPVETPVVEGPAVPITQTKKGPVRA